MIKSPLRYPGGKSRAINFLKQYVPPFQELREPFFGGGSFSIHHAQAFSDKKIYASDLNYELYCFWSQLKNNFTDLMTTIQNMYATSKVEINGGKKLFDAIVFRREDKSLTECQRGADFFVLNRITFSGVVDSGGYSQESFDKRFTFSSIDRVASAYEAIKNIEFNCDEFIELINKPGKDVLLYLDPPYYSAEKFKLYGKNGILHTGFNHQLLYETLKNTTHKWIMTYDNSAYIKNLYKEFYQIEWTLKYVMSNNTETNVNELLIANFNLEEIKNINSTTNTKRFFVNVKNVPVTTDMVKLANDFADNVLNTVEYNDTAQDKKNKIKEDHCISKIGEEAVWQVLNQYVNVTRPDYTIYKGKKKSWVGDLMINGETEMAVKTQTSQMAKWCGGLSWTFQYNSKNNRKDPILKNEKAWVMFVEYDKLNSMCYVYPAYQIKDLLNILDEPIKEELKPFKKVVYASKLPHVNTSHMINN